MSRPFFSFILWVAVIAATPSALAKTPSTQTPLPGDYETLRGWGSLYITAAQDGALSFQIDAIGANAHVCSLSGKIKGNRGYTGEEGAEAQCVILFEAVPNGLSVSAQTGEACSNFCGVHAGFEGAYLLPPAGCKQTERWERRDSFTETYRLKDYPRAYETLDSLYRQCGEFMNWVEIDHVRNDLAITQYHLGHKEACLDILKDTIGATQTNEKELGLPPADLGAYLPVAQATWHNLKLCGKGAAKPQKH